MKYLYSRPNFIIDPFLNSSEIHFSHRFFGSHAVPERFDPFAAQYTENHHERVEEVVEVPAGHRVRRKDVAGIIFAKQLHPNHGEDINYDDQNESQVS